MLTTLKGAAVAVLMLGLTGCGGGAASADEGKSVAEIQASVKTADKTTLQTAVESYQSAITAHQGELEDIQAKIKELGGGALNGLLGGKADETKADLQKLQAQASEITATLKSLKQKLDVYVQALASANG